jgi:dihydroxyacid dehydratase/phosphogluconate dehydratase
MNITSLHRHGGVQKFLSTLLRFKLIYHDCTTYNGQWPCHPPQISSRR